ncbi:hypothetical protein B0H12DRAFT_1310880, partial [Mycena haematopus]
KIQLFPRTFAEGTAVKPYQTLSVDPGDYSTCLEPSTVVVNKYDAKRIPKNAPWGYLIQQELKSGPAHVAVRGKCLAITAGHHALICHFDLEGNLRPMKRTDFDSIVAECVKGNNPDPSKAERLRSFILPTKFVEPAARQNKKVHKINIMAAIVMDDDVFIITDFSRMTRLHVVSCARILDDKDLQPDSVLWNTRLWRQFGGGPDWIVEQGAAFAFLDTWRERVLSQNVHTAIIDALLELAGPGAGIGQHLANDFLFGIGFHPDTPSSLICSSNHLFSELKNHFPIFMETWTSPQYLKRCAGRPNSKNPFIFNYVSDTNFLRHYVRVYRKLEVRMDAKLYDMYQSRGLFDPLHTIGTPYHGKWTPTNKKYKIVEVRMFEGSKSNRYHVIRATPPAIWNACTEPVPFKDVTNMGFTTTLGPASFYEPMQNKLDIRQMNAIRVGKRGQPRKEKTGKPGRPRKALTQAVINRTQAIPRTLFRTKVKANRTLDKENQVEDGAVIRRRTRSQG